MEDRAKSIFLTAVSYSKAAQIINSESNTDPSLLMPSQVNAALALELYFKSLYFIEKSTDFKIKGRHSHDFSALFFELSENSRQDLERRFQELMTERDMLDVQRIESVSKVIVPRDIAENLQHWSDVFTKVRYIYDKPNKAKSMMFFPEIEQVVKDVIYGLRPEYKS